jgi:broad specificity phosphatase PhoE
MPEAATETRVLLLRHAETSEPDRFHGAESDVGLGERGFEQAETVAQTLAALAPQALYSSGMRRSLETAGVIARVCDIPVQVVGSLHERRMGPLSGVARELGSMTYQETKARWMAGDLEATHEGGESFRQIRDRVLPEFLKIAAASRGTTVIIVAHGVVIRVLLATLVEGYRPADFDRISIDFVAINVLRWDGARWSLAEFEPPARNPDDPRSS